jgi:hypothetical protein
VHATLYWQFVHENLNISSTDFSLLSYICCTRKCKIVACCVSGFSFQFTSLYVFMYSLFRLLVAQTVVLGTVFLGVMCLEENEGNQPATSGMV